MFYKNFTLKIIKIKDDDEFLLELFRLISIYHFEHDKYPYQIIVILIGKTNIYKMKTGIELLKNLTQKSDNMNIFFYYLNLGLEKLENAQRQAISYYICDKK